MIKGTIHQCSDNTTELEVRNPEPVWCFRHNSEDCPRCDGSGYRRAGAAPDVANPPAGPAKEATPW